MLIRDTTICLLLAARLVAGALPDRSAEVSPQEQAAWLRWAIPLPKQIQIPRSLEVSAPVVRVLVRSDAGEVEKHAARQIESAVRGTSTASANEPLFEIVVGVLDPQGKVDDVPVPDCRRLSTLPNREQAYLIRPVGHDRLVLAALDEKGVCYACRTLCQLLECRRGSGKVVIPLASVTDWPDLAERGLWGCRKLAELDIPGMVAHKLNLVESHETQLRVLVAPLSSPHRTRVLATLCAELNATATLFPGTRLVLRYEVNEVGKQ